MIVQFDDSYWFRADDAVVIAIHEVDEEDEIYDDGECFEILVVLDSANGDGTDVRASKTFATEQEAINFATKLAAKINLALQSNPCQE